MSRVLTTTVLGDAPHRLLAASRERLDPVVGDLVDQAAADGFERGLREGHARGTAEVERLADERVAQLSSSIAAALDGASRAARATSDDVVESAFDLAVAMAEAILGRELADGGSTIGERVRESLESLDDRSPVVLVSADDVDLVAAATADLGTVTVEVDPRLAPGEARVRGGWAEVDLTRATAFATIRRGLGVDH